MKGVGIAEMSAFAEIAAQGSFAKAAAQLGVSRSRLSETIRLLEERLGVRLLNRTTRSVSLTEAGERLLARLRPVLDDFESALDAVNTFRDSPAGRLRLTVPPPAQPILIQPLLARFMAAYPDIQMEVSVDGALVDIVAAKYDAGVRIGEKIDQDMVALRLSPPMRMALVGSPDYLARAPALRRPEDLAQHNCVRVRFPSGHFAPFVLSRDGKGCEVDISGSLITNDINVQVQAARDGIGLAYTLYDYAAADIESGALKVLLQDWMPQPVDLFLYYPSRRQIPAPLQAFISFLRKEKRIARG